MLGVLHHMRWQHVEGNEISHHCLLGLWVHLVQHVRVNHLVSGGEVVLDFLLGVVELNHIFSEFNIMYSNPVLMSLVRLAISFFTTGLKGKVVSSGSLYSFFTIAIVWLRAKPEKPISISFWGFSDLW